MNVDIKLIDEITATKHFDFVFGRFTLSRWAVPYFCTTMSVREVADSLQTVRDFPGWENNHWTIEELFQRDIDWDRVTKGIVPYLRNQERSQFFNSLTVALLPRSGSALVDFSDLRLKAPPIIEGMGADKFKVAVGPLQVGYWGRWDDLDNRYARFGSLRWNTDQVFCVAIDGQHRLAALKVLAEGDRTDQRLTETRVPVNILVFAEQLGFRAPAGDVPTVRLLRDVFIDLNKHAVKVSRSRLILLDDRDPVSVSVRALVGNRLTDGLAEMSGSPPRLPLSLIDWHTDSAKFDDGPYITTVIGLDWICQRALGMRLVPSFNDYSKIRKQIREIEKQLDLSMEAAKARLATCQDNERPFNYDDGSLDGQDELAAISEAFGKVWGGPVVHLLTEFQPYKSLVQARSEQATLTPSFVQWYQLWKQAESAESRARKALEHLEDRLKDGDLTPAELRRRLVVIEGEKAGSLAFNVAFQRAYFLAFAEYQRYDSDDIMPESETASDFGVNDLDEDFYDDLVGSSLDEVENDDEAAGEVALRVNKRAQEFVTAMNSLIAGTPDLMDVKCRYQDPKTGTPVSFWLGTLWKPEGGIDFTQGASGRASHILLLGIGVWVLAQRRDQSSLHDFETLWLRITERRDKDTIIRMMQKAVEALLRRVGASKSAAARMVPDGSLPQEENDAIKDRLRVMYEIIVPGGR